MSLDRDQQAVRDLVARLDTQAVRGMGIEALRRCRALRPDSDVSIHDDFGYQMVPILAARAEMSIEPHSGKEAFYVNQEQPWMREIVEFLWWFIRAGLAIPRLTFEGKLLAIYLTTAGIRFLEATQDHPLLPGALDRVLARCPGLPDEVTEHLLDALSCLEHALARPSIVLMGLAYEVTIDKVVELLHSKGVLKNGLSEKAAKRIAAVKAIIRRLFINNGHKDQEYIVLAAWDFADALRRRRNDGSHPRPHYDFADLTEIQEFFVSAARHLPALWSVTI
jgi:hypothetical protein